MQRQQVEEDVPHYLCFGVEAVRLSEVAAAIHSATGFVGEPHESSYLGDYELFKIPEVVRVKFNFVDSEDEWDYPDHQELKVLIEADGTDRPDHITGVIESLGLNARLIAQRSY